MSAPEMQPSSSVVQSARRVIIKAGSSLVTNEGRGVDLDAVSRWAGQIAGLRSAGKDVILVSSGAIAEGMRRLGWSQRPREMHQLQAAAAVGQMGLAQAYETAFRERGMVAAQVLLTHADLADRQRYLNARTTLLTLLEQGVVPVINENDTVVTDEIKFGDNDTLGALVTNLVEGDVLIILTDQSGLYSADPRKHADATLIAQADAEDATLQAMAGGAGTGIGTGGMATKVTAARRAARSGAHTVIASGREPDVLLRLARGEIVGTQLLAGHAKLAARKQWMADHLQLRGWVRVDEGAARRLRAQGASLLPVGVVEVQGDFDRGDVIAVRDASGAEVARGLSNYAASQARRIMRHPSADIEAILGFSEEPELIHRDNMVFL
ncbi:Glutamate 5-kinase [Thiomonas arsenitoxydans]|uniref:Glutamate 5-kinase n=2 Tax=Thiomonas arsenitoxydans (strain DSM 22701 / CIP 110005 / 3As) TaxID=426114 RepID=A0ABM9T3D1_THIA3|nr:Glutamate 5-kinase [Thiomonas arsenitoxydans]CQR29042.1 Glutamate 5-kinase [Thiomonas arsenitoxydans]CQR30523.1 Glutamate 5-kinase [Thiomonas arsenitoxydans]CQR35626.1 Glutamate 5-kinase [Thiomonas arsenitoxydans]